MTISSSTIEQCKVLSEVCQPLKELGVVFFGYTAIDENKNAYCLGSKLSYAEAYIENNGANADIHGFDEQRSEKYEYDFWDFVTLRKDSQALYQMAADFDQSHTMSVTRHEETLTQCYHFSGAVCDDGINQRYLDNLNAIHMYIDYFDECLDIVPELKQVFKHPVALNNHVYDKNIELITTHPKDIDLKASGVRTLKFKHFYQYYLTKKERNCLYWLKLGKSAEMISVINDVSRKTVERYIASIKKKLDCYTLFQLGMKLGSDGLDKFLLAE